MKKILGVFCFVSLSMFSQAQTEVKSVIKRVTVYLQGAQLVHESEVNLTGGKQTLVFTGLSADMLPESVVLEPGTKSVVIKSVSVRNNYMKEQAPNSKIFELQSSLLTVQSKLETLRADKQVYERERDILFKNESIGGTSNNVPVSEIEKAANFFRSRNQELSTILLKLRKEEAELVQSELSLRNQLNELNAKVNPPTSEVTVVIDSKSNERISFVLKYLVRDAGWAPKYDVRAENSTDPVTLDYHANVFNHCGIDWEEVKMVLSTSTPMQGAEKPTLEVWDVAQVQAKELMSVAVISRTEVRSGYFDIEEEDKNGESDVTFQTLQAQELNTEFPIEHSYSISSDGKPNLVDVTSYTLPAKFQHYAVPKQDADAFLMAKVVGWNTLNLISGNASVYFAGAYLGQSFINTASTDDTLSLSLGRDNKIMMVRKKQTELSKRQFIGNNEKETFYFETIVRNNRDKVISLVMEDQLPISSKGDIEVTMLEISGATLEKNTGKLTWNLTLAPGESRTIVVGYSIKSPKGAAVQKAKYRTINAPSF